MTKWINTNWLGLILLMSVFAIAMARLSIRKVEVADPNLEIIRFAHYQLYEGMEDAFESLIEDYEKLHPGVKIIQMRIPRKVAPMWVNTQLIGGTAPDLIELPHISQGLTYEQLMRYFLPLSGWVDSANPYNRATDLENIPWRETFIDNLENRPAFYSRLMDYYGIPLVMSIERVFYNKRLLETITGRVDLPLDFREFMEVCDLVRDYASENEKAIFPLASSKESARTFLLSLFSSQTQKLTFEVYDFGILKASSHSFMLANLRGEWNAHQPAVASGLKLMREAAFRMQPGFSQFSDDDALFLFAQKRALMFRAKSENYLGIKSQIAFPLGIARMPYPSPDDPEFGPFVVGQPSEAHLIRTDIAIGVTRFSLHPQRAVDFLQFLTSKTVHSKFSQLSKRLPVIRNTPFDKELEPFYPVTEGYLFGASFVADAETRAFLEENLYLLGNRKVPPDTFQKVMAKEYSTRARKNLEKFNLNRFNSIIQTDLTIGARLVLDHAADSRHKDTSFELNRSVEIQNEMERQAYFLQSELDRLEKADNS